MRLRHPTVYRPLVDLATMEDRHIIITYNLDRATIHELCAQLEPDLMSAFRHPTGISPLVQVLSVHHFLASSSFQTTVAMASGISQPMFSNVLSRVLSALLKHMCSYIIFPQVEDLLTVKGGSLYYSPKKVCQIFVACCMLHNLALRRQVPFLQEDGPDVGLVAAVEPVDSEEEEAEEEDIDNRNNIIMQYFQ
ncbi:hypothetical protein NDU88_001770 [Pleurodeles waltl]|uniref:Nuclease HARBI1 n=1 Tax=Pleurodeles waltl TaxID=8319 RepID=A0AAV7KQB1_PLEWA|nr:hypothetical protein NDU88_001770 [Pleurodeles waltl]